jgi:mono/diheme cytochrome c family protein
MRVGKSEVMRLGRRNPKFLGFVAAALIAIVAAGLFGISARGGSYTVDATKPSPKVLAQGKAIFKASCGGCHTLADAKTHGTVGPNLDTLKPSLKVVARQVTNGGSGMPAFKGKLSTAKITAVATYVSSVAGKK